MTYMLHVKTETPSDVIKTALEEGGIARTKAIFKRLSDDNLQDLKEVFDSVWPAAEKRITEKNSSRTKAMKWIRTIQEENRLVTRRQTMEFLEQLADYSQANPSAKPKRKYTKRQKPTEEVTMGNDGVSKALAEALQSV